MRVLIVDDERRARERFARLLAAFADVEIVGEAEHGIAALEAIQSLKPDAVFLDVQMPALDGLEVVAALAPDSRPSIVFVTAYDQYALRAFEVSAVDYLMKPVEEERLAQTIAKLRDAAARDRIDELLQNLKKTRLQRVVAKRLQKYHVLPIEAILAFVAEDELVFALTPQGRYLMNTTLRDLETQLDSECFARVHKQTIVNLSKIVELEPILKGGATARLEGGETIEISRRYAPVLRDHLHW